MTADPEAVTRALSAHRPLIETPTFARGRITGCTCGFDGDGDEYRAHLASVLASLPDDRLAEAEADHNLLIEADSCLCPTCGTVVRRASPTTTGARWTRC